MSRDKQIEERQELLNIFASPSLSFEEASILTDNIIDAGYHKQSVGEWKDNHCTSCGMTPIDEEAWTRIGLTPPKFEYCMSFCPNCGAKMKGCE